MNSWRCRKMAEALMLGGAGAAVAIFLSSVIPSIAIYGAGCVICLCGVAWTMRIDWAEYEKRMEQKRNGNPL